MCVVDDEPDHYLRSTTSTSIPHSMVFFACRPFKEPDAQSGGFTYRFRVGAATHLRRIKGKWCRRDSITFKDNFDFWLWLLEKQNPKDPMWMFSHDLVQNAAYIGVWDRVDDETLKLNLPCRTCGGYEKKKCKDHYHFRGACVISNPPIILRFKSRKGIVQIVDIMNYWRTCLDKIGQGLNYPRLSVLSDNPGDDELLQACEIDAGIIEKAICGLMEEWETGDCGAWATTAAGLSWSAFRRTVAFENILIDHEEEHTDCERAAYHGGQAEAYYVGYCEKPIYLLDVKSLYPSVMAGHYFPVHFLGKGDTVDIRKVNQRLFTDSAVAYCTVRTEGDGYPKRIAGDQWQAVRQARTTGNGKIKWQSDRLGFPVGEYATALCGPELSRAIERDELVSIQQIYWYRQAKIFDEFVERWFAKRPPKVTPETFTRDLLCKTVLNSLYGKFGQHKLRWKDRPDLRALERWGEWQGIHAQSLETRKYRAIGGSVQVLEEGGEARDSFAAIAAYVTAYGREQMLWLREKCPPRSIVYQHTDSLLVYQEGFAALSDAGLIGAGELGKLRFVDMLYDLEIYSINDYEHNNGKKLAGVRPDAERLAAGVYREARIESIAAQWSRTPDGSVRVEPVLISLERDVIARSRGKDGWTIPPRMRAGSELPF